MNKILLSCFVIIFANINTANAKQFTLNDVEMYLSDLKNYTASFDQVIPGEDFAKGKLYIKKPGKFLWQYKLPNPSKVVSNGGFVYFVDEVNEQTTQLPNTGIIFQLLSKKNVNLNGDDLKLDTLTQTKTRLTLRLIAKVDGEDIPLTLILKKVKEKLKLSKIISYNQLDQMIVVSLYNIDETTNIDKQIFKVEAEDEQF